MDKVYMWEIKMEHQQRLKERFMVLLRKDPKSVDRLSRDVGINKQVFHNFWNNKVKIQLKTMMIIENYLEKAESAGLLQ
jgi:hypothetical protein